MKKMFTCLLTALGLTTACGLAQQADNYEVDEFQTKNNKTVKIHALVHASIWIEAGDVQIYIDPVTKSGNRKIDYSALPKADIILVTHEHYDHLDKDAIRQLTQDGTQLIMNPAGAKAFGKGRSMANGDKLQMKDDVSVEAVPAYNTTKGHTQFHPNGRDNGYILMIDGLTIYIAGDTEDIDEMAAISGIDIAFLPCNQPYTMTPEQVVKAAKLIRPKVLFPYHYGETDLSTIPAQLSEAGIDVRIRHYE